MLKAELKVVGGTHDGKLISLAMNRFLIGRGDDCQLRPASDQISRHHCAFSVDDYTVRLRDLGSTNGTHVNGDRLQGETILKDGDHVRVGSLEFHVQISPEQDQTDQAAAPDSVLPIDLSPDTAELSTTETAYEMPVTETQANAGPAAEETTAVTPQPAQPLPQGQDQQQQPAQYAQPAASPAQPYPVQPVQGPPGAVPYPQPGYPYPQQPGMPYPQQPGMPYPQQPYPVPGYMPVPGQPYPQPVAVPPTPEVGAGTVPPVMPVKLPSPESTGAKEPEPKPEAAQQSDQDESAPQEQTPSTSAADIIKNMRNRRPPGAEG